MLKRVCLLFFSTFLGLASLSSCFFYKDYCGKRFTFDSAENLSSFFSSIDSRFNINYVFPLVSDAYFESVEYEFRYTGYNDYNSGNRCNLEFKHYRLTDSRLFFNFKGTDSLHVFSGIMENVLISSLPITSQKLSIELLREGTTYLTLRAFMSDQEVGTFSINIPGLTNQEIIDQSLSYFQEGITTFNT